MSLIRLVALVVILALLAAMIFALGTSPRTPDARCSWINAEAISEETVKALRGENWYSDPNDSKEALYSPACLTPEAGA